MTMAHRTALRNIGIISHINAGKTTTTERILFYAGKTQISGDVDKGNTVTDYLIQERNRGITITSAAVSLEWSKNKINLIDTPGHIDFTFEVERSLSVLDGAVTIIDASAGVEAQTMTVWNQASKYQIPSIIYLNKCDKPAASFENCLKDLRQSLGINPALMQLPVISLNGKFESLIDIVRRNLVSFNVINDSNQKSCQLDIREAKLDASLTDKCEMYREEVVNKLSDLDDTFASHVLDCSTMGGVCSNQIREAMRRATLSCNISPVFVGSSFKNIGVQPLLDGIIDYLPNPDERRMQLSSMFGNLMKEKSNHKDPFCGFIFKIIHDKHLGPLTYLRIYSGSLDSSEKLVRNITTGGQESIKSILEPFADNFIELKNKAERDDIVVLSGLQMCRTGEILTNDKSLQLAGMTKFNEDLPFSDLKGVIVPHIEQIDSVYYCTIESPTSGQQLKLEGALRNIAREDPSFSYEVDETGFMIIRGMGKLHLEVVRDRIETEYGINATLGPLQIAYRESVQSVAEQEFHVDKTINGVKNLLTIKLQVKPKPNAGPWSGKMLKIDNSKDSELGTLRPDHRNAIENGLNTSLQSGPTLGFPIVDCEIKLLAFKSNSRCSYSVISSGASQCISHALAKATPTLLEPIMDVEIVAPKEKNGSVLSDLRNRRGDIKSTEVSNETVRIKSQVPLAAMGNYSEFIRKCTSGRASFSMRLCGYAKMTPAEQASIVRC